MNYTATQWNSIADKEKFVRHFKRFVETGMKKTLFPKWFYTRLSMTFGHIAHYNQGGFYDYWFSSPEKRLSFLRGILEAHICGDPAYTYSDAERNIQIWLRESGIVEGLEISVRNFQRAERRKVYEQLKQEFEPSE